MAGVDEARKKNKGRFDRTHRLRPKKIEEGDWVLVYDNNLDNQHMSTRKFARCGSDDNATYHLVELDGMRIAVAMGPVSDQTKPNQTKPARAIFKRLGLNYSALNGLI